MTDYLFGNPILALVVAVIVACGIGLASSFIFTWASSRSAFWNMGFAAVLIVAGALGVLLVVAFLMSRVTF